MPSTTLDMFDVGYLEALSACISLMNFPFAVRSQDFSGAVPKKLALISLLTSLVCIDRIEEAFFSKAENTSSTHFCRRMLFSNQGIAGSVFLVIRPRNSVPSLVHEYSSSCFHQLYITFWPCIKQFEILIYISEHTCDLGNANVISNDFVILIEIHINQ